MKKALKITAVVFVALLLLLVATPFLFKDKIIAAIKTEASAQMNARLNFDNVDISFIRQFPKLSVAIDSLSVVGVDDFEGDTLLSVARTYVALDVMSVIRGNDMKIHAVTLAQPRIFAIVNKSGKASWDIMKPTTASESDTASASPFKLSLNNYKIENAYIVYRDETSGMSSEIFNLSHEGKGDFTNDLFLLKTNTTTEKTSFVFNGIPYLNGVTAKVDADIEINNTTGVYTIQQGNLQLNNLKLKAAGFLQALPDSSYRMDLSFGADKLSFKDVLSLIPAIYQNNFSQLKTSGNAAFSGMVKGVYSETQIPAFNFNLNISDGFFQYPGLPAPVKNVALNMEVANPDGKPDNTVVQISKGHIEIENNPVDFRLLVKNPVTDLYIDAFAKGVVHLSRFKNIIPLDKGTTIDGTIQSDIAVKGRVKAMQRKEISAIDASGSLAVTKFKYASAEHPDGILLNEMHLKFNPKNVTVDRLNGSYLNTSFNGVGTIDNLLAYALAGSPLKGSFQLNADKINLNKFLTGTDTAASKTIATGAFVVPGNIDVSLLATIGEIVYDKMNLYNVSGMLSVVDETVLMKNIKANAFDGSIVVNGSYSTKNNKKKPEIALSYDLKNINIKKSFYAVNTAEKLMPAGKFMAGTISSQFSIKGQLGEEMAPDLNTLSGGGNLYLLNGVFSGFEPVNKLASTLNVQALKDVALKDVKADFDIANGKILLKPFKFKVNAIDVEAGGMHGIDQSLDYTMLLNVPRSLLGGDANNTINSLISQAAAKGFKLKNTDVVPLKVGITGFINKPQIKTDLKETTASVMNDLQSEATAFVKAKADSAKQAVKDSVASAKNQVVEAAKQEALKALMGKDKDTTKETTSDPVKKLEETGKGLLKNLNPFKKD